MMRRIWMIGPGLLAAGLMAGCGEESPTDVGSDLLGPGVQTYEVIFEAAEFLVADTTYDQIGTFNDALFFIAANPAGGELEARTLFSLNRPATVTYTLGEDGSRTDSIQDFVGGTLTLVVDTLTTSAGPIDLEVVQVLEEWDRVSATWTTRIDTAGVRELWAVPGAGSGPVLGRGTWADGDTLHISGDTLRISIDAAAVAVWDDSTAARMGGLVRAATPDSRIFFESITFEYDVIPVDADTVVQVGNIVGRKVIAAPDAAPPPDILRVGGLPAWRSLLRFRPLTELQIPCAPGSPTGCAPLGLDDVTINVASLLLEPVAAGPRRVESPTWIEARAVLQAPGLPLVRMPLTPPVGLPTDTLPAALFSAAGTGSRTVSLPITSYVRRHLERDLEEAIPLWLALTAGAERSQFGYSAFAGIRSDLPPRLRLVVSVPDDVLMR